VPYLIASEVVFHKEALYQVYAPLPLSLSVCMHAFTFSFEQRRPIGFTWHQGQGHPSTVRLHSKLTGEFLL